MTEYKKGKWYMRWVDNYALCSYDDRYLVSDINVTEGCLLKEYGIHVSDYPREVDPNVVLNSIKLDGLSKEQILDIAKVFFYDGVKVENGNWSFAMGKVIGGLSMSRWEGRITDGVGGEVYSFDTRKWATIIVPEEGRFNISYEDSCGRIASQHPYNQQVAYVEGLQSALSNHRTPAQQYTEAHSNFKSNNNNMTKVTRKQLKEIHDIACGNWKEKIKSYGSRNPLEDSIELSDMEIKEMFTVFYFKDI